MKIGIAAATTVIGLFSMNSCQPPAPSSRPVVWATVDEVIPRDDPRQDQLDGSHQLNLIYPNRVDPTDCANRGGHVGSLPDTCYDVDY